MNFWILVLACACLFFYILWSIGFTALANFKHHDFYKTEDITYERRRPEGIPDEALLIDTHCHTTASDGLLEPKQLVLWSISNGYDGLVVSDHNTMDSVEAVRQAAAEIKPDFIVIPGIEFTCMRAHMNLIGIQTPMPRKPGMLWCKKEIIKAAIDHAHAEGGVVTFNHREWYPYNILKYLPREWWLEQGIDGWEVYNGFKFTDEEALAFIKDNMEKRVMFASAGTDIHDPAKHYRVYTEVLTSNRTVDGIIEALKEGKTRVHFDKTWDVNINRPERGKIQLNPERQVYLKKTLLINWIGVILFTGKGTWKIITFLISTIVLGFTLSLLV